MNNDVEGSNIAHAALLKATIALDRIEQHERVCGQRWGLVVKLLFMSLGTMLSILGVLLFEKIM